ncbi:MAG: hypothetical protein AYK19_04105 [Theionarchaea archaeon DG-70-1]|nr:MAG: hypothetical protein AYK19_04105 [Theionarchaea archaeon DG-70-1]
MSERIYPPEPPFPGPPPPEPPPRCDIDIEAIKFNHDTSSLTSDAMNIRKNKNEDVEIPEWKKGENDPKDSPAAYAIKETENEQITIEAKFTIDPPTIKQAKIKAEGGGILGKIEPTVVEFENGVSKPEYVSFELKNHTIGKNGIVRKDIEWRWKYICYCDIKWRDMRTTKHRIYVVLEEPPSPWMQAVASDKNPWTDALDKACVIASGKKSKLAASTAITKHIYSKYGLAYDIWWGAGHYSSGYGNFDLTAWLNNFVNGKIVNCYDCAASLAALGNVVGCDLTYQFHGPFGYLNIVVPIGRGRCNNPFYGSSGTKPIMGKDDASRTYFGNHAYTKMDRKVFDATMQGDYSRIHHPEPLSVPFWLINRMQNEYERKVIDISTPAEKAADQGTPQPQNMTIR